MRPVGLDRQSTRRRASPRPSAAGAVQPATESFSSQEPSGQPLAFADDVITGRALEAAAESTSGRRKPKMPAQQRNMLSNTCGVKQCFRCCTSDIGAAGVVEHHSSAGNAVGEDCKLFGQLCRVVRAHLVQ